MAIIQVCDICLKELSKENKYSKDINRLEKELVAKRRELELSEEILELNIKIDNIKNNLIEPTERNHQIKSREFFNAYYSDYSIGIRKCCCENIVKK